MKGFDEMKIEMKNISKKFDGNVILKNVNLTFEDGHIYGFIGRNGSGKSVLLKILCGFYTPTEGSVYVDGKNVTKDMEFLPDTRVLIEKPTFLPDISGIENLKVLASIHSKIDEKRVREVLDLVCLSKEDQEKKFHKYSLGMKQKLGIAQVLMEDPKVMIFDEPLNGIEDTTAKKIREILKEEKKKGKIILLASHIKEDIDDLADILFKVDEGEVHPYQKETKNQ